MDWGGCLHQDSRWLPSIGELAMSVRRRILGGLINAVRICIRAKCLTQAAYENYMQLLRRMFARALDFLLC